MKECVSIYPEEAMRKELEKLMKDNDRSMNYMCLQLIKEALQQRGIK